MNDIQDNITGIIILISVAFIVLKVTGMVAWDWLWVLAPMWATVCALIFMAIVYWIAIRLNRRK